MRFTSSSLGVGFCAKTKRAGRRDAASASRTMITGTSFFTFMPSVPEELRGALVGSGCLVHRLGLAHGDLLGIPIATEHRDLNSKHKYNGSNPQPVHQRIHKNLEGRSDSCCQLTVDK